MLQTEKEKEGVLATIGMNTSGNMTMRIKNEKNIIKYEKCLKCEREGACFVFNYCRICFYLPKV